MAEDGGLFDGLPPPSAPRVQDPPPAPVIPAPVSPPAPKSASEPVKSALKTKRPAPPASRNEGRQVRFKTTTELSKDKAVEAMQKIAAHIANPAKFSKASKLALQLLTAGSVTAETSEAFFGLLEAAMSPPSKANAASERADYQALFSAVEDKLDCFTPSQRDRIEVWLLWAQLGNDFFTDDTFVFSKAASRLRNAITSLPEATAEDDTETTSADGTNKDESAEPNASLTEQDPFNLNAFFEDARKKKEQELAARNLLRDRREALVEALAIATKRYKQQWAQTILDITSKHASENRQRFNSAQRERIEKLCLSVKEQQVKRKQGKSNTGKLDVTSFERYREKYSNEKISIRKAVGASGDRGAEQWLG